MENDTVARVLIMDDDSPTSVTIRVGTSMQEAERRVLLKTLAHFNNDKTKTAKALGVSLKTIYNKLARY